MRINKYSVSDMNTLTQDINEIISGIIIFKDDLKNKNILITGATGLLGKLLVLSLSELNEKNNLSLNIFALLRDKDKTKELFDSSVNIICQDITKPIKIEDRIDYIFHCASPTASLFFVNKPVETIDSIVTGTKNILDFAKQNSVKKTVYLSSMEVYGECFEERSITEDYQGYINPLNVRSSYSIGKRLAECMCYSYYSEYSVPVTIARLVQTFGAGMNKDDNRVINYFARSIINKTDIVLRTTGETSRAYLYTVDAIIGLFYLLFKGNCGEAYNIANDKTYMSIKDMAYMAKELANNEIEVRIEPFESAVQGGYNPETHLRINSSKICDLGWRPKYDLNSMCVGVINYLLNR